MDDIQTLITAFRARRHALGLTQGEVARAARVSRQTVSDFENGRAAATLPVLVRMLSSVGLELATREAGPRPTLDELAERYADLEGDALPAATRRVRKRVP
jgi:transcriptional regulator with XRE-family HTH domain